MCPEGTALMWEGYSLLHILGNGHSQGQDLGLPGSCLRKFSTMPYLFCNLNEASTFYKLKLIKIHEYFVIITTENILKCHSYRCATLPLGTTTATG